VLEDTVAEIFAPQEPPTGYMAHFGTEMTLRRGTMRANAQQVNALKPYVRDMAARYPTLTLPVESVHGTADDTVPLRTHAQPLERQIDSNRLTLLDGVGHMPHHTNPQEVIDAIDRVAARAGLR
jgi:pimeloyl-ACP methyl ester carboxylesterase